jgi:methyl-accepting chemotaxis protein
MNDRNGSSRRVSKLMPVVDEIAFQASILALNASVETAGAGEDSRQFALVAQQVRDLALGGARAVKEAAVPLPDSPSAREPSPVGDQGRIS